MEDVRELCTDMAIINNGEVLLRANPKEAVDALQGKVWKKVIEKNQLEEYKNNFHVISEKLLAGNPISNIYSLSDPGSGFVQTEAGLKMFISRRSPDWKKTGAAAA